MIKNIDFIVPVYNGEVFVCEALQSIFDRALPGDTVILIDDCSTDSTWELMHQFSVESKKHNINIIFHRHDSNQGVAGALNTARKYLKNDFCLWLSHDDLLVGDLTAEFRKCLELNKIVWSAFICGSSVHDSKAYYISFRPDKDNLALEILGGRRFFAGSVLFPGSMFRSFEFDPRLRHVQDIAQWLVLNRSDIVVKNEILGFHRVHQSQDSKKYACAAKSEYLKLLLKNLSFFRILNGRDLANFLRVCLNAIR